MRTIAIAVGSIALGFVIAGCASDADKGAAIASAFQKVNASVQATPTPTPDPAPAAVSTAQDVVDRTGCTGLLPASSTAPFAATFDTCTWHGERLQVYTFGTIPDEESFLKAVRGYGVVPSQLAMVDLVIVAPADATTLPALRKALGV